MYRLLAGFRRQESVPYRGEQLVDVGQLGAHAGADDQVQVVVLGVPGLPSRCEPADIELEVLIGFMAGVEMEHRGAQPQRRQQPGLHVVKLGPSRGGAGHVQAPRLDGVDVHSPHDALRIGVGAGAQVERLVLGSVDGVKTSGAG
jgi:excinuclease ABC subunit B